MKYSIAFACLLLSLLSQAQSPVNWTFSSKKISDKTYEVTLAATVQSPWHIYSQTTPDGGPVATSIDYSKNPLVEFEGKTKEEGKIITKFEDVFGVNVIYFNGTASFVQKVKVEKKIKTNLSGKVKFMVCNDQQCLPPTEVPFSIALK